MHIKKDIKCRTSLNCKLFHFHKANPIRSVSVFMVVIIDRWLLYIIDGYFNYKNYKCLSSGSTAVRW